MSTSLTLTWPGTDSAATVAHLAAGTDTPTRITGPAVPLGIPSGPSADGARYQFDGLPENVGDLWLVVDEHDDRAEVGRLSAPVELNDAGDCLHADARIFGTTRGRDVLIETAEGIRTGFSVGAAFDAYTEDAAGVRHVTTWTALHLGVVRRPAFTQAAGLTLAASAHTTQETTVSETTPLTPPVVELPTIAELAAQVAEHQATLAASRVHPLAQYPSATAFYAAFQSGDEATRTRLAAAFAVVDQITTDNPGVMPPAWRTDIKAHLDRRRPLISAFGTAALPDTGMDVSWPYYDGDLTTLIAEQVAEKTELHSTKISIDKATVGLKTAGAVSDISYQLLMRSSPSYLAAHNSILMAAWALWTEAKFSQALKAAATPDPASGNLSTEAGLTAFKAALFDASGEVEDATGAPASIVAVGRGLWAQLGANPLLVNAAYGTQNVSGTKSAATLRINIDGLEIERGRFLGPADMLVSNDLAAKFSETGPMIATEENVTKLGRDVAVWGMYTPAEVYFPAGIKLLQFTE